MTTSTILIIVLILLLLGVLPAWPHSAGWGYYPSGGIGLVLLIVVTVRLRTPLITRIHTQTNAGGP